MKPARFEYRRAESVEEAVSLLGDDAKPLAGGQSLVPLLNMRILRPSLLVDLNRVPGLDMIDEWDGGLRVGALVRQSDLERSPLARARCPLVVEALAHVGHFVTRNRGTVGGSIAHADPAAELPLVLVALGGSVVAQGPHGRRTIPAEEFFVTHYTTALAPDELVVETHWPAAPRFAFEELTLRRGDFALTMAAVALRDDGVRVAVGAVTERPTLVDGEAAAAAIEPVGTVHASADYLKRMTAVVVRRAIERAAA